MSRASRRLVIAAAATPTIGAAIVVALIVTAFAALAVAASAPDRAVQLSACGQKAADGLTAEQTGNAAIIAVVAADRSLGAAGAVLGVMTAMTESSLINVDYGDTAGPDSRGLFQQRDPWGPISVRMDPAGAAGLFYDRLATIGDWRDLAPWVAAQQVQRSAFADGSNYAAHYQAAVVIMANLTGDLPLDDEAGGFDVAEFCAGSVSDGITGGGWGGYSNGLIPATALCPLTVPGQLLRCDATQAWDAMAAAFHTASGSAMCITDSYRSLDVQIRLRAEKPTLAAVPGTSNHGWALAVDLCEPGRIGMGFTTDTYLWLETNAAAYGFTHPAWAEPGRGQEEPWHWEYTGGAS
jgi:hypothetical protein